MPEPIDAPPRTLALLPLLYVAWADGALSPLQAERLRSQIQSMEWLDDAAKEDVTAYLDPQHPPTAAQYARWQETIRERALAVSVSSRCSLAELGASLALSRGDGGTLSESEFRALQDLESALDIDGTAVARDLLAADPPEANGTSSSEPTTFDPSALQAVLDGGHADLRDRIRTLLSKPAFAYAPPLGSEFGVDAYREQVRRWTELLADAGLGALAFPERYGGSDDVERFVVAFETLAAHDLSLVVKFGVQFGLFAGSILRLGTQKHHERYLEAAGTMDLPGCFAMSERGHGSNVRDLETTARYDPEAEEFVINTPRDAARKEWIGNAAEHGRMATVFAQLHTGGDEHGVHAFLVPIRTDEGEPCAGVRIEDCGHKLGLNGVDNGRIWFDEVRIPRENLLDRFGSVASDGTYESPIASSGKRFFTMLGTLVAGRISVGRAGLMAAKSGLTIALRYGTSRRQFGPKDEAERPLMEYRTHRRRLLPPLATTYGLHFALDDLTRRFAARGADESLEDIEADANALKAYATGHTISLLQTAREACGGQGYLTENRIADLKADTDVFATFEGDNTVLFLQVAKGLLSDFHEEFQDMNVFGLLRFAAEEVATRVVERNPVTVRNTEPDHLRSTDFQTAALAYRRDHLLQSAAQRLKRRIENGIEPFDAFTDVQDHLVDLARAHAEDLVLRRFLEAVGDVEAGGVREVLGRLRSLYGLSRIEADLGWFLEAGYISSSKSKAIRGEVNALCDEIHPDALELVDGFAIPDACLAAPIAT